MDLTTQDIAWAKENIRRNELFTACTEAELSEMACGLEKQNYGKNQTVLFQGEISSRLCMVQSGVVSVWVRKGKDKVKVADLESGAFFGEISLLTPRAATATIKSEQESEIIFLPGEVVQAVAKKNPAFGSSLDKRIHERLEKSKEATEHKDHA
jgi:CRP-like cAMP-binding protein